MSLPLSCSLVHISEAYGEWDDDPSIGTVVQWRLDNRSCKHSGGYGVSRFGFCNLGQQSEGFIDRLIMPMALSVPHVKSRESQRNRRHPCQRQAALALPPSFPGAPTPVINYNAHPTQASLGAFPVSRL